ncbi:flagellar motor switch protein FliG [Qipengyuania sp.]|uniref:flagellar motor switch protein FliG n=1 Tax=Qipengyuania sp. TaxID=2004515 RepID=UPI0035C80BBC
MGLENVIEQGAASGLSHAALMVLLLEEDVASSLLAQLSAEELKALGKEMVSMGEVDPTKISHAIAAFANEATPSPVPANMGSEKVRHLFTEAVGPMKADSLMRDCKPEEQPTPKYASLELLKWLDRDAILPIVIDEHPQVVTALLMQMNPETAAHILAALPEDLQADLVHRVATIKPISLDAIAFLAELVEKGLAATYGKLPITLAGLPQAADIVNSAAKEISKKLMPKLAKRDKIIARKIEEAMFSFDLLFTFDPKSMGTLLREVESEVLIDALKGIEEDQRELFFAAMSSRAADGVRDEIEARGRLRRDEVDKAQRSMIDVARRLAAEGTLSLGGDDDYV